MEKFMKELCEKSDNRDYFALEFTHFFWSIFDSIHKSNMADIFKHLYMSPKRSKDILIFMRVLMIMLSIVEKLLF